MSLFFERYDQSRCCLCGTTEDLTGEHKIAASALRAIFGKETMAIGNLEGGKELRSAQGPKSKQFHFKAKLCRTCNSSRTQAADREFVRFDREVNKLLAQGGDPADVFVLDRYQVGTAEYLNVFRYLAELICCHLADSEGPRPRPVGAFVIGQLNHNNILLQIDRDPIYDDYSQLSGEHSYAAHGGLAVYASDKTRLPKRFQSSLTLGPARYRFWIEFDFLVALDLQVFHNGFVRQCRELHEEALANPISDEQRHRLGI